MDLGVRKRDLLVVTALWLMIALVFWNLQDEWSWNVLFPLTGFVWVAGPLLLSRFQSRPVLAASVASLIGAIGVFLALVWAATGVLGFLGSLIFDLDPSNPPSRLVLDGLKVIPGAIAGALGGIALRSRGISMPVE